MIATLAVCSSSRFLFFIHPGRCPLLWDVRRFPVLMREWVRSAFGLYTAYELNFCPLCRENDQLRWLPRTFSSASFYLEFSILILPLRLFYQMTAINGMPFFQNRFNHGNSAPSTGLIFAMCTFSLNSPQIRILPNIHADLDAARSFFSLPICIYGSIRI